MKTKLLLFVGFFTITFGWGQAILPVNRTSDWNIAVVAGWIHTGTVDRASTFACTGNNAETFDTDADRIVLFFNAAPSQLIFKLKSASMAGASSLLLEQSADGTTYTSIGAFGTAAGAITINDCADITVLLNATTRYLRWTYTKANGNVDIDDVRVGSATAVTTITTSAITGSPFCVGNGLTASVNIPYTISGIYGAGNIFTAQLSDDTGGFLTPTTLGTLTSTTAGAISGTIPASIPAGTGYRIRVIASDPATTGSANTVNLVVQNFAAPTGISSTCGNTTSVVSWTNPGCFDQVMLVAKTGAFSASLPTGDGTAYTANLAFGTGTGFDGGFVVNKSAASTSGTITGLTNGTAYTFKIFVRKGTTWLAGGSSTCTPLLPNSAESDLVFVAASAPATISSTVNNPAINSITDGVQVMQFTIRDGGPDFIDADLVPTILTGFTLSFGAGNQVADWSNAIQAIALFDGTIKLANGTVSGNTIVFNGLSVSTGADTSATLASAGKTLLLRLSLKCPLIGATEDGQDFVFSITAANTTFATTGSSKSAFAVVSSGNNFNIIDVQRTRLVFSTQPSSTAVNTAMSNVVVKAVDACGNTDINFVGQVALSSSGTMTGAPILINASAGLATYSSLLHTVSAANLLLTATSTGITTALSSNFDISNVTVLEKGDLAILAVNTNNELSGDEFSFVCFKDILPGTQLYFTDNGYERVSTGQWGDTEGVFSITRTGTILFQGTIVTIKSGTGGINENADILVYTCGGITPDPNWNNTHISGLGNAFNLNENDQIWIMQGGSWGNLSDATNHNATYTGGNVLYGWTEFPWYPNAGYASTEGSTIYPGNRCYSTDVQNIADGASYVKFNDPTDPDFFDLTPLDKIDWIAIISDPANWNTYADDAAYDANGYQYQTNTKCPALTITAGTFVNGAWTGRKDTNWFDCNNWDTLEVPTATTNVTLIASKSTKNAAIVSTATDANLLSGIAKCNNLTISDDKVQLLGSPNNKLEINGNLIINSTGALDMDDLVTGNSDGQLYLKGNWDNQRTAIAFAEGDGTVHLTGTVLQDVKTSVGPEIFTNLIIDNPSAFSTNNFNSDLIANGNLELKNGADLLVKELHYATAGKNLTIGAGSILNLEDDATLYQSDDSGTVTNNGTTIVNKKSTPYVQYDYTFWSSPIVGETIGSVFASNPANYIFSHSAANFLDLYSASASGSTGFPQISGTSDTFDDSGDDWIQAAGSSTMAPAKGYVAMGNTANGTTGQTAVFTENGVNGRLNNGLQPVAVTLDKYTTDGLSGAPTYHTNSNLIGNPYPSAIDTAELVADNPLLTGTFYFWTHDTPIADAAPGPWAYNFTNDDYVTLTAGTGSNANCAGCPIPDRFLDSCQSFFANVNGNGNVTFNNSQRVTGNNSSFYRPATSNDDKLWLNFNASNGEFRQILVGFVAGAEDTYNPYYDGLRFENGVGFDFYSYIPSEPQQRLAVQGLSSFNLEKTIPLGIEITQNGTHKIAIDHFEGVFENGQAIYLQDNLTDTIHDFANGEYSFSATTNDAFNNRFLLRFTNPSLGTSEIGSDKFEVSVFSDNEKTNLKSQKYTITKVTVYDLLGRQLLIDSDLNILEYSFSNSNWSKQALIVKIELENGTSLTKKIRN